MAKGSHSSCAVALVLSQALWVLPGIQPASAQQVTLPRKFHQPRRPARRPGRGAVRHRAVCAACIQELAIFAWQEFIALNWVAMDPATSGKRGRPAPYTDPNTGFLDIAPDASGSFPLLVWQTYRHKNELFPADGTTDMQFDSSTPTYSYADQPQDGDRRERPDPELQSLQQSRRDEPDRPGQHVCTLHSRAARISAPRPGYAWPTRQKSTVRYSSTLSTMGLPAR